MHRNPAIDNLKCIGLLCIMLAHVGSPFIIMQLRNFDVPLMIICSSILFFRQSHSLSLSNYILYFKKRIKRLILPTWLFLTIYFGICALTGHPFPPSTIFSSYALYWGIGYVWILRIFLLVALLLPLLDYFLNKNSTKTYFFMFLLFLCYEAIANTGFLTPLPAQFFISFIIPVASIICFAFWIKGSSNKNLFCGSILCLSISFFIGYTLYTATGYIYNTNFMKYPFRIYYLGYAIGMNGLLVLLFRNDRLTRIFNNRLVTFIRSHSLWIYLWHILFVTISPSDLEWWLRFAGVLLSSLVITFAQTQLVNWLEAKHIAPFFTDVLKG